MSPRSPRRARRGGAALIEFALIMPLFLAIMLGTFDVAWLFWQNAAMQVAVQDGCRVGALIDPGQDRQYMADLVEAADDAIVARLEALGVMCKDCEVEVAPETVAGVVTLDCSMERTGEAIAGLLPDIPLATDVLTQMEVQR